MRDSREPWALGYRPGLDGLRGIAVLMVVLSHSSVGHDWPKGGAVGVTVFFVLSGFLITSLLMSEVEATGRVRLTEFYRRRALRLLPAFAFFLLVVSPFVKRIDLLAAAAYVGNWRFAGGHSMGFIDHTWSLAVEEQFYLLWPIVLVAVAPRLSRPGLYAVCGVGIVASAMQRVALGASGAAGERIAYASDTNAEPLLVGCALAIWLQGRPVTSPRPRLAIVALGLMAVIGATPSSTVVLVWLPTAVALLSAFTILAVVSRQYAGWLTSGWLVWTGRRSYGLYLWHFPCFWYVAPAFGLAQPLELLLAAGLSLGLTLFSWRYIEAPCHRLKDTRRTGGPRRAHESSADAEPRPALPAPSGAERAQGA